MVMFLFEKKKELPPIPAPPAPTEEGMLRRMEKGVERELDEMKTPAEIGRIKKVGVAKGPMFVSLQRYNEIKESVYQMQYETKNLRKILISMQSNKSDGTRILKQITDSLENLKKNIDTVSEIVGV